MSNLFWSALMAQRHEPDEAQIWAIIILGIISALGHLLRKRREKRGGPQEAPRRRRQPSPPPSPPEPVARTPGVQRPERPARRVETVGRARPAPPIELPPRRPARAVVLPTVPASPPARELVTPPVQTSVQPVATPAIQTRRLPARLDGRQLAQLLRSRQDTRIAVALSEILSPPLALR